MPKEKGKFLNFDDRCEIEDRLKEGDSFRSIARALNVSPTTISNEVKRNRVFSDPRNLTIKAQARCANYSDCRRVSLCDKCNSKAACCKRCGKHYCFDICRDFEPFRCKKLASAPYVCNKCKKRGACSFSKARYLASKAQAAHDRRLREAHLGIATTQAELEHMVSLVKKLLTQGQSLEAIWATHGREFPVCVRSFYNYIERGVMGLANIELPKKVKYAPRKKRCANDPKMNFEGRTYKDWCALSDSEKLLTVQIDTVEGLKRNSKCILTLHFVRLFFQLHILMSNKDQDNVGRALDAIETYCEGLFAEVFPILLADRGSEFLNPERIEQGLNGKRCRVFYCDPVKPGQKGAAEKNHVELRKILPKGTDFDELNFADVSLVSSHVNSYVRAGQGIAPIEVAKLILPANLLESLGVCVIAPDDVIMKPSLLKQQQL